MSLKYYFNVRFLNETKKSSDITLFDRNVFMKDGTLVPSEDKSDYSIQNSDLSNFIKESMSSNNG